jgi:hypothetical protein
MWSGVPILTTYARNALRLPWFLALWWMKRPILLEVTVPDDQLTNAIWPQGTKCQARGQASGVEGCDIFTESLQ